MSAPKPTLGARVRDAAQAAAVRSARRLALRLAVVAVGVVAAAVKAVFIHDAPAPAAPADSAAAADTLRPAVRPAGVPAVPPTHAATAGAAAAATPADSAPPAAPDTIVVEREVYGYDGGGRRDPFRPLIVTTVLRPFASELRLVAVAYDASGANSVAILRDQTTKAQHRVRAGQLVGRMRVVRIQPKAVVFAVEELGFSRRETLTLQDSSGSRQP